MRVFILYCFSEAIVTISLCFGEAVEGLKGNVADNIIKTSYGTPVDDIMNSITVGSKGPQLKLDVTTFDALLKFVTEKIPQRGMTGRGAGAFGYFEVTNDITSYCKAKVFSEVGKRTRVAMRISLTGSDRGMPDTLRNTRVFGIKFYTDDGNWDLLGAHAHRFFINDGLTFINNIHALGRNPATHLQDANSYWDFNTLQEQSIADILLFFSFLMLPDGFRHMHGHSLNTFKMVNKIGKAFYVRFHWISNLGFKAMSKQRGRNLTATDPDYSSRDFYNSIMEGNFPSWILKFQVMTFQEAETYEYNPFYGGRVWPEDRFPNIEIGKIVLNELPKNYFADVEQLAFSPGHLVPGIEPSPDRMLQLRLVAYSMAAVARLGPNYSQIPVNRPLQTARNYLRDGQGTIYNQEGNPTYYPNSLGGPECNPNAGFSTFHVSGDVAKYNSSTEDNFDQATNFWNMLTQEQQEELVENIVESLSQTAEFIKKRTLSLFKRVDNIFHHKVQNALMEADKPK